MDMKKALARGTYDEMINELYVYEGDSFAAKHAVSRMSAVLDVFAHEFLDNANDLVLFSSPGRTEIGGNHTDHQHGNVLCGSVDMDMLACAGRNDTEYVRVVSEGFEKLCISLNDLEKKRK